jgi:hypothetical protein
VKDMLHELLWSADPAQCLTNSFRNYHARGVDYLCLLRNNRLTVKVYIMRGTEIKGNDFGWLVWPHNHRYTFESWTIAGEVEHRRFEIGQGTGWWMYHYEAEVRKPTRSFPVALIETNMEVLKVGDHFAMGPNEIHTIAPSQYGVSAFFQLQYRDVRDHSLLFAPLDQEVSCDESGLYLPVGWQDARALIDETKAMLEAL